MTCQIRRLERADFRLLRELRILALQDSPEQFGETVLSATERSDEEWARLTESAHVAELDGGSVGMAFLFEDPSDPGIGRIGGMWVAPALRRAGVGSALLGAAHVWAVNRGKRALRLWAVPGSPAAELYARARFVATGSRRPFPGDAERAVIELELVLQSSG